MYVDTYVYEVLQEQHDLVMALDDAPIIEAAKEIAFYSAMIDAALDDPMDDAKEQDEMLSYLKKLHTEHVEQYQQLVNERL